MTVLATLANLPASHGLPSDGGGLSGSTMPNSIAGPDAVDHGGALFNEPSAHPVDAELALLFHPS